MATAVMSFSWPLSGTVPALGSLRFKSHRLSWPMLPVTSQRSPSASFVTSSRWGNTNEVVSCPRMSQARAVLSAEIETSHAPFGENSSSLMSAVWPTSSRVAFDGSLAPSSHSRTM
jgi:hypothetical protein